MYGGFAAMDRLGLTGAADGDENQALGRDAEGKGSAAEGRGLGWCGLAGGAEGGDLLAGGEGGAAHGVEGFDDVAVVGVEAPDPYGGVGSYVGELEGEGLCGAGFRRIGGRWSVDGSGAGGWGVVPEGDRDRAVCGAGGEGGVRVELKALGAEAVEHGEGVE